MNAGKDAALGKSAVARDAALGAAKPPGLRREQHQEGKDGEGGGIRLVMSRPAARRTPAASGSTKAFWVGGGAGEAWGGSEPVVASIGLTEGKEGRSSGPRTKAWGRVGRWR